MLVNPAHLIDEQVKVEYDSSTIQDNPACVTQIGTKQYLIRVFSPTVNKMLSQAPATIPKDYFVLGLLYHEIAHIRCESFKNSSKYDQVITDPIHHWVTNIIEDARIEYQLSYNYPYVAKFIALLLLVMKNVILTDATETDTKLEKQSQWLLKMVRLNTVPDDCDDEDFVAFMLPRILLARRGNRAKAEQIIYEIYQYIVTGTDETKHVATEEYDIFDKTTGGEDKEEEENESKETDKKESKTEENESGEEQPDSEGEEPEEESGEESGEESSTGSGEGEVQEEETEGGEAQQKVEKLLNELQKSTDAGGIGADNSVAEIIDDLVNSNEFIRTTIRAEADNIKKVHKAFSEIITKMGQLEVKEGDLNILRVQEAYLNQQVYEEGYDYYRPARITTGFDCVILRDISGSTNDCKEDYARATCILAKAMEELKHVRVQIVDFEGDAHLVKPMEKNLSQANLAPLALGGTQLSEGLQQLQNVHWKHNLKLVIILTDGAPNDCDAVQKLLEIPEYNKFVYLPIVFKLHDRGYYYGERHMRELFGEVELLDNINNLHKTVYKLIRKKVLKNGGNKMSA